jgi:signal transduction histidine kinase
MSTDTTRATPEREQTDESLRAERDRTDDAVGGKLIEREEAADDLIFKARQRADEVLSVTRGEADQHASPLALPAPAAAVIERERVVEDELVQQERAEADEVLRVERAEHARLLTAEREETDKDLLIERARADLVVATRDEFLGVVSHDLRNMLNSIMGFASLIAEGASLPENEAQVRSHAQRIQRSGARMNRLVGDLVDIASIEAGKLAVAHELTDPARVVTEAVETFQAQASAKGISLVLSVDAPPLVAFDPARILQVLTNLISNAIKFSPPGGQVSVRVERADDQLRFQVIDDGIGIPADKLDTVFERFLQVAPGDRRGVGLGLYISRCIVQGHGGKIWAESAIGQGTTVTFTLPLAPAP